MRLSRGPGDSWPHGPWEGTASPATVLSPAAGGRAAERPGWRAGAMDTQAELSLGGARPLGNGGTLEGQPLGLVVSCLGRRSPSSHGGPEPAGGTAGVPPPRVPVGPAAPGGQGGSPGGSGTGWPETGVALSRGWAQPGGRGGSGWTVWGRGRGLSSRAVGAFSFLSRPSSRASSPLRLAGCVLRPVPRTGSLTHQTLLPPHQGNFCIFLRIPAWQGLPASSRPGPEQGPWAGRGGVRPQGTLFPCHPQPLWKGRQSPQARVSGAAPGPSAGKPEPGQAGERVWGRSAGSPRLREHGVRPA